ncbi:MAG: beta-lactamase family protein [Proteobacteria bacterium]|nr:beta-lactamase family protein [Pseudomonadota bacterium]
MPSFRTRRIHVPSDLAGVTRRGDEVRGLLDPPVVENIWRRVRAFYRTGVHPAISLCIRREGQIVLNRSIGHASGHGPGDDGSEAVVCTPRTPFCIFSASKAVTAMVIHLLDDRGLLHVDDRIVNYIPEFGQQGKGRTTIRHVLTHRAGIPNLEGNTDLELLADPDAILRLLCEAAPTAAPGHRVAYHAITGGFVLGEVVKRVTGKTVRQVLAEEILDPLGFNWMNYGVRPEQVDQVAINAFTGRRPPALIRFVAKRALGVPFAEVPAISNDPRWLEAIVPSGNVVSTADELSRFFQLLLNGGELDGVRIMEQRTVDRARNETSYLEMDFTLGVPVRYGVGLMLGDTLISPFGADTRQAFGHLGFINCFGWADPERQLSVGLLTSGKPAVGRHLYPLTRLLGSISAIPKL